MGRLNRFRQVSQMRALSRASSWRGRSGLPRSPWKKRHHITRMGSVVRFMFWLNADCCLLSHVPAVAVMIKVLLGSVRKAVIQGNISIAQRFLLMPVQGAIRIAVDLEMIADRIRAPLPVVT